MYRPDEPHALVLSGLPPEAGLEQAVRWAVAHAALAPSEHNSQPWSFRVRLSGGTAQLDLLLDPGRRLPVVDPTLREAVLACGAALLNLRLALAGAQLPATVTPCPDPARPDLLARVQVDGRTDDAESPDGAALRRAIALRGTHRGPFEATDLPADLVARVQAEAVREGALAVVVPAAAREALLQLTCEAERTLWTDGSFRREAASWFRDNAADQRDGVPGYAYGMGALRSWLQPTLERSAGRAPWSFEDLARAGRDAPVLVVVGARNDGRPATLAAGSGMQRLLLRARAERAGASYLNGGLHVPALRAQLGVLIGMPAPQVVLRLGYGDLVRPTPRRGVADLLQVERG